MRFFFYFRQYEAKDKLFRTQLASLGALLPIIQVHLLMCTTFSSSASKYEFLELVFILMERLGAIAHLSHPLRYDFLLVSLEIYRYTLYVYRQTQNPLK